MSGGLSCLEAVGVGVRLRIGFFCNLELATARLKRIGQAVERWERAKARALENRNDRAMVVAAHWAACKERYELRSLRACMIKRRAITRRKNCVIVKAAFSK